MHQFEEQADADYDGKQDDEDEEKDLFNQYFML